jgi:hypothetical protein
MTDSEETVEKVDDDAEEDEDGEERVQVGRESASTHFHISFFRCICSRAISSFDFHVH